MGEARGLQPKVDSLTLVGLVLLLDPLLTMLHELGGHGGACLLTDGSLKEIGAHYVECASVGATSTRIVAVSGAGIDLVFGAIAYVFWRSAQQPLWRTALWIAIVMKLLLAAGYPLFSGLMNVGDFSVGAGRSLGELPSPGAWRTGFTISGAAAYVLVMLLARRMLGTMLGGGEATLSAQHRIPMALYIVGGAVTLLAAVPNPTHKPIVLSAAATFGGLAGLFNVAFRPLGDGSPKPFTVNRSWPVIIAGIVVTALFVAVLGPSVQLT